MNDFIPDPAKNFTPRQNAKKVETVITSDNEKIDIENPAELRKLAKTKLVSIIQASSPTPALVGAIKELLDRVDGKAKESVEIKTSGILVHFNVNEGADLIMEGIRDKLARRKMPPLIDMKPVDNET